MAEEPKTAEATADTQAAATPEKTPEEIAAEAEAKAAKKAKQDAKKQAKIDAKAAKEAAKQAKKDAEELKRTTWVRDPTDACCDQFGDLPLNRSQCDPEERFTKKYTALKDLTVDKAGEEVRVRCRVHNQRGAGNACFLVGREVYATAQFQLFVNTEENENYKISKGMIKYATKIPKESIVEIIAKIVPVAEGTTLKCSQQVEMHVKEIWTVNKSALVLPFQIEDASRQCLDQEAEARGPTGEESKEASQAIVYQDVRLNNRVIDLRVPSNQAIFRLQSGVCQIYREFMLQNDFVEIHSPKLIGGASEGGSNVFHFMYFDQPGCLAQSPQLYKQMALCGDLQRVFEIGPVFRAEDSNTNRHLCEFTGLDMEMEFKDHYFEVLDLIGELMVYMVTNIKSRFARELSIIHDQYPFEEFKIADPVVKIDFRTGCQMLAEAGVEQDPLEDLSTETEKALGRLVREKHDTDFYMLYGYPTNARPFYTMLDPKDPNYTNSYDFFMRGEEITSGAQRVHDPVMLAERAKSKGIPVETIQDYIESFRYGAPTHAGAGFGLERIVKFFCGLHNIRKTSLFPRDPKRLHP